MQSKPNTVFWNLVFVGIIAALFTLVYLSTSRINYNWNWERVVPYIIDTQPEIINAPLDGDIVKNSEGTLILQSVSGDELMDLSQFKNLKVAAGDLVFEGDTLAEKSQWKLGTLSKGVIVTIQLSVISLVFAIVIGMFLALMRLSSNIALRKLAVSYIELIRGTPLLVQIFIVYFFIGTVLDLDRFTSGVVALSMFTASYVAEIIRAGIQGIHKGQMEASRSLGMTYPQSMSYVILPQAFKQVLPPLAGQFINLIKDSSLVSVIAITDLTKAGREVVSGTFAPFEVWITVALLYLLLTGSLSWGIQALEKRLSVSD